MNFTSHRPYWMKLHVLSFPPSYSSLDCWLCWTVCCCVFSIFAINDILFPALSHLAIGEDNVLKKEWLIPCHPATPCDTDFAPVTSSRRLTLLSHGLPVCWFPMNVWDTAESWSLTVWPSLLKFHSLMTATVNKLICTKSGFFFACVHMYIQLKLFYKYGNL